MGHRRIARSTAVFLVLVIALASAGCPQGSTQKLATASDAIAHALVNAQTAARQGLQSGVISAQDEQQFEQVLSRVSQAGMVLDQSIRANESATTLSAKVNSFLDAFNALNTSGIAGIKNPGLQLTISTILTGAETSVAIIAATVGK